jgi:hypothetical protein
MTFKSLITVPAATRSAAVADEEVREVSAFDAVTFNGSGDLIITVGEEHAVVL